MLKTIALILAVVLALPLLGLGVWAGVDPLLRATGGEAFCTICHTMEPFAAAYRRDVHGGRNAAGLAARCNDCHLPHSGPLRYLAAKARFGLHDVWAQLTRDLARIDWQARRAAREEYVFDSGCLLCHSALAEARGDSRAFVAHRPYFLGETARQCVSCHPRVGHRDLTGAIARIDAGPGAGGEADDGAADGAAPGVDR